jgi:hypothetical protein
MEQSDLSRLSYGISSSLCLKHLEQVRNANITDDHFLIPVSIIRSACFKKKLCVN